MHSKDMTKKCPVSRKISLTLKIFSFHHTLPSQIVGGLIKGGGVGSPPDIGNLGGGNKLKWVEVEVLIGEYLIDLGGDSYVTNCKD